MTRRDDRPPSPRIDVAASAAPSIGSAGGNGRAETKSARFEFKARIALGQRAIAKLRNAGLGPRGHNLQVMTCVSRCLEPMLPIVAPLRPRSRFAAVQPPAALDRRARLARRIEVRTPGRVRTVAAAAFVIAAFCVPARALSVDCGSATGVSLQVLGSGGPIADDDRAGSGYLLRDDGRARLLVDAGAGVFQRFGASGARLADLDAVVLSHLHTDHSAAFPALVKSLYFSDRTRALAIVGPDGDGAFPALDGYLAAMFGRGGAYAYLGGALDGSGGMPRLAPVTVPHEAQKAASIDLPGATTKGATLSLEAVGVHHGIVPTLALRARLAGTVVVFASDQSARNPHMAEFAAGADLLVVHAAIPEGAGRAAKALHRTPSELAALVRSARPGRVLVSHWMRRSLAQKAPILAALDEALPGRVAAADDLDCLVLD